MQNLLTKALLSNYNYYHKKISQYITKPESRFVSEVILGILKGQKVTMNHIAINIKDKVSLKKTLERFRRHFKKGDMWIRLILSHLMAVSSKIRTNDFAILDISDIKKDYAVNMDGLERIHDGSKKCTGIGYWLMNIISLSKDGNLITPLYNKLYSFKKGTESENAEILQGISTVLKKIKKKLIWVIDRGGDRKKIIIYLLKNKIHFIIRMVGDRYLYYRNELLILKKIARKVNLKYCLKTIKTKKHKSVKVTYYGGAVPVQFPDLDKNKPFLNRLWLVVFKTENKGYSWFLVSTDKDNEKDVVEETFRGYGYRWKIEEYHRHIKSQFHLEKIQLRKFESLQTMLSLITIAMNLIYSEISCHHQKLLLGPIKTMEKYKLSEMVGFIYYKISTIVKNLLANVTTKTFLPDKMSPNDSTHQLTINLAF